MRTFILGDSYDTPENTPHRLMDRLMLKSRWYFIAGYINVVLKGWTLAVRGLYDTRAWRDSSYTTLKLVEGCGGRVHIRGIENLRSCKPPVVFVSNHMSTLETFAFPCLIAPFMKATYVVKKGLVVHPLFGPLMRARNPIVVNRKNPREDFEVVMTQGKELLAKGISIIIFPQSTRRVEFVPEQFNTLGIKLAKSAGVQIVPIAVKTDFWGNGKLFKDIGFVDRTKPVHIAFGKPLTITGNGKTEHQQIIDFITTHIQQWGGIVRK